MENTIKPGVRVKVTTLYKTLLGLLVLVTAVFAVLFVLNKNPFLPGNNPFGGPSAPVFSHMIYGGFGEEQLTKPMAVTTIGDQVFVSDSNKQRVQVFDKQGNFIRKFGENGTGKGQFQFPYGITQDAKGRVLVADMYNRNISVFDVNGKFIEYFGMKQGIARVIQAPSDIKFIDNKLYVADVEKNKVFVFDSEGKLLMELGKDSELYAPNGVTVNPENGDIYVVDTGNQRVVVYDKTGSVLGQFNGSPNNAGDSVLSNPRGIAVDARGTTYVVSNLSHLIYGFGEEFNVLFSFGGLGDAQTQFTLPNGIHIDENNNIYITDTINNRIAVYQ